MGSALAAGQALGALGTDTGGSIRIPAAFCGVTGHKPTYGLVGRGGVVPLSLTLDHAGPMTRTVEDCALMLSVLAGPDDRDYDSAGRESEDYAAALRNDLAGVRLAVVPSLVEDCQPAVFANFERSLEVLRGLGADIGEVEPLAGLADDWRALISSILTVEGASYIEPVLRARPEAIGQWVRSRFEAALETPVAKYARALEARKQVQQRYEKGLDRFDAYVLPTSPRTAEPIAEDPNNESPPPNTFRNTSVFDQTHQPSISGAQRLRRRGPPDRPHDLRPPVRGRSRARHRARVPAGHRFPPAASRAVTRSPFVLPEPLPFVLSLSKDSDGARRRRRVAWLRQADHSTTRKGGSARTEVASRTVPFPFVLSLSKDASARSARSA